MANSTSSILWEKSTSQVQHILSLVTLSKTQIVSLTVIIDIVTENYTQIWILETSNIHKIGSYARSRVHSNTVYFKYYSLYIFKLIIYELYIYKYKFCSVNSKKENNKKKNTFSAAYSFILKFLLKHAAVDKSDFYCFRLYPKIREEVNPSKNCQLSMCSFSNLRT